MLPGLLCASTLSACAALFCAACRPGDKGRKDNEGGGESGGGEGAAVWVHCHNCNVSLTPLIKGGAHDC